jgi:hypothetical protein
MSISPIFIIGAPRSGTTLLRNLLYSHPNLFFRGETHFIPDYYRAFGDPQSPAQARRLARRIVNLDWMRRWEEPFDVDALARQPSYAGMIDCLFRQVAQKEGAGRWGDKTPQNVLHVSTLLEIFPKAQFIHIVRDGRDAALSLKKAHFGPTTLYGAILYWQRMVRAGIQAAKVVPRDQFLGVKYEDLLDHPREELEKICTFLYESFVDAMLSPTFISLRHRKIIFKEFAPSHSDDKVIVNSNKEKWRSSLTREEQELCEHLTGKELHYFNYPLVNISYDLSFFRKTRFQLTEAILQAYFYATMEQKKRWLPSEIWLRWVRLLAKIKN